MIAVIFEVVPTTGRRQEYLDLAGELRPALEAFDGFISVERFESLTQPGKLLSLSCWRDEEAVRRWRNLEAHRSAQIYYCLASRRNWIRSVDKRNRSANRQILRVVRPWIEPVKAIVERKGLIEQN